MRWWVVAGAALLLGLDAYGVAILGGWVNPTSPHSTMQTVAAVEVLIGILIVLELIQGDPLVGTRQFWLTRPISGRRLLAMKTLTALVILVGLPVALSLPWWLVCGFGVREVLLAVVELTLTGLAIGLPSALVSGFCDSRGRALLWGVLAVPLVILLLFVSARLFDSRGQYGFEAVPVIWIVGAAVLAAAAVTMFLWRRWGWSTAVIVVGVTGMAFMPRSWRAPVQLTRNVQHPELAAGIKFDVAAVARPNSRQHDRAWAWILAAARDVPTGRVLLGGTAMHTWSRVDGAEFTRSATVDENVTPENLAALGLHASPKAAARLAAARERERGRGLPTRGDGPDSMALSSMTFVPLSIVTELQRDPRAYRGEYLLRLAKPVLEFELPVRAGETKFGRGFRCHVQAVFDKRAGAETQVALLEAEPDAFIGFPRTRVTRSAPSHPYYAAIDSATRETEWADAKPWRSILINGVMLTWRQLTLNRSTANVALGRVTFDEETWFTRQVTADPLRWKWLQEPGR